MSYKESLINCMEQEINVAKTLYTKLPKDSLDFSPGEKMRTTLEVLRYLTWCASSTVNFYMIQETDPEKANSNYADYYNRAKDMKPGEFPQKMDEQFAEIKTLLAPLSDEDLLNKKVTLPWNIEKPLGEALMETALKWLTAYKMQLFLYAKMGNPELNTIDCWIYTEPQKEKAD